MQLLREGSNCPSGGNVPPLAIIFLFLPMPPVAVAPLPQQLPSPPPLAAASLPTHLPASRRYASLPWQLPPSGWSCVPP